MALSRLLEIFTIFLGSAMGRRKSAWGRDSIGKRKVNVRPLRDTFLIVCVGKKTEPNYFKGFPVKTKVVEFEIRSIGEDPINIVQETIARKKELEKSGKKFVQIWCVFDKDEFTDVHFNNAISLANDNQIKVAYSNEAFELWYLLHFHYYNTPITRKQYYEISSKLLRIKYEKNDKRMYDLLFEKQDNAICNSIRLLSNYIPINPAKNNPSTTVHELVQELNRFM